MTVREIDKIIEIRNEIKRVEYQIRCLRDMLHPGNRYTSLYAAFWRNDKREFALDTCNDDKRLIRKMCFLTLRYYKKKLKKLKSKLKEM